jgi:hypothetical protein
MVVTTIRSGWNKVYQAMSTVLKRVLLLVFCAVGVACAGPETKTASPARPDESGKTVYLASHGWHAGIVIRRADIPDGFWPAKVHLQFQ